MNRSKKLRSVYAELKSALGDDLSSQELLDCAAMMVDASEDSIIEPSLSSHSGRLPFSELPVNQVIENYGWKILNRECLWEDDYMPPQSNQQLIEECLLRAA